MYDDRMNIIVFDSGNTYTYHENHIKPLEWMALNGEEFGNITHIQGPVLDETNISDLDAMSESILDELFEWLYGEEHEYDRDLINGTQNASLQEFLSLAFSKELLENEFDGVMDSVHQVHDTWMEDQYGVSDGSQAVLNGLVEIDWDEVSSDYDSNAGKELLEGEHVVYLVSEY